MGTRQVYIKTAQYLNLELNNLKITKKDCTYRIPIEDINSVFLEDPNTVITSALISKLSEEGISLIICNEKYTPSAMIVPISYHYHQTEILKKQISINTNEIIKGTLWKKIISKKIENQSLVIKFTNNDEKAYNYLSNNSLNVKENDSDNREGISAKVFFSSLYGNDYIRFGNSPISSAQDYGYTIIHSTIVRVLNYYGFNTSLGIWHDSNENNYNLASDLIEPFRPIVDYYLYWKSNLLSFPLSKELRYGLIQLLNEIVLIDGKRCKVEYAIHTTIQSLQKVYLSGDCSYLKLPDIAENDFLDND